MVNRLAAASPELDAASPFTAAKFPPPRCRTSRRRLLLKLRRDRRRREYRNSAYEAALKANNKKFTMHTYPGTQHAFFNDTGAGALQTKRRADLAWSRTLAFFKETLGAPSSG